MEYNYLRQNVIYILHFAISGASIIKKTHIYDIMEDIKGESKYVAVRKAYGG